jgi:predicted alpha/beta hydrolase family esterase
VLSDFAPVPSSKLPYRNVLVASTHDPYCPVRLAGAYARNWGSEFVRVPDAGHINVESGHGDWPLGVALLQSLLGEGRLQLRAGSEATSTNSQSVSSRTHLMSSV